MTYLDASEIEPKIAARIKAERDMLAPLAVPYRWRPAASIPRRDFLYGHHYIREFVSCTVGLGGGGKSSLGLTEACAMVSGKPLLGVAPTSRLRVWIWCGEDPPEETERRLAAINMEYSLGRDDLDGLFLGHRRDIELIIAKQSAGGAEICSPDVDRLTAMFTANGIDVAIIDPFISCHNVTENDNVAIDLVAKQLAKIAGQTSTAIDLVHHTRKTGGQELTVEDGRGAVALLNAARSARVLNTMTKDEAALAGVERARSFFRVENGKANLAPAPERADWYRFISVDLCNGPDGASGDSVGVVKPWEWPDLLANVTADDLLAVQTLVAAGDYRANPQANDWVGLAVADVLKLDITDKTARKRVGVIIKKWIEIGGLAVKLKQDAKRKSRPFVVVGRWADQ